MNIPRAESQQEKSVYATLIIDCILAGLPGEWFRHTAPCMGGDKKEDARRFSCHLPQTSAGGMYIMCVCFLFPLKGHYLNLELNKAKGWHGYLHHIHYESTSISAKENNNIPSHNSECAVREKEGHILCRGQPRVCRNCPVWVQRQKKSTNLETNRVFY